MDDLILKLKNLQVLLEEAHTKGAELEVRFLISEIKDTVEAIENKRALQKVNTANSNN